MPRSLLYLAALGHALSLWLLLPPVASAAPADTHSPAAQRAMGDARNALLQGNAPQALAALASVPAAQFSGEAASERACIIERFDRAAPPPLRAPVHDAFTRQVIEAYQSFWWHALKAPAARDAQEAKLMARLRVLTEAPTSDDDALAARLLQRLQQAGYHALPMGRTLPLQELMLWRREELRDERVALPEHVQAVRLHVLDDFVVTGWSHYARCGHGSAGGWADGNNIFMVFPAYGTLDSERFRVTLLGHEAQHVADYARHPGLVPWELEFRAKLAELSMADEIQGLLLQHFASAQSDDISSPHTYANRRVLQALAERLGGTAALDSARGDTLRAAARAALLADSARRSGPAP